MELKAEREKFIDLMGKLKEADGLSPISGKIVGLLVFDGRPYSFSDLATELGVSRGSISSNTRRLVEHGVLRKVNYEGDRQDYFEMPTGMNDAMVASAIARASAAATAIRDLAADLPESAEGPKTRIEDHAKFYDGIIEAIRHLTDHHFAERQA